jgi:hypothetical protein
VDRHGPRARAHRRGHGRPGSEQGANTATRTPQALRARRDALEEQAEEEIVYAPLGSLGPRELRAMAEALR